MFVGQQTAYREQEFPLAVVLDFFRKRGWNFEAGRELSQRRRRLISNLQQRHTVRYFPRTRKFPTQFWFISTTRTDGNALIATAPAFFVADDKYHSTISFRYLCRQPNRACVL